MEEVRLVAVEPLAGSGIEGRSSPATKTALLGSSMQIAVSTQRSSLICRRSELTIPGQCTYNMLAHPASISSLSLSPDSRELVSAGHDASLRFRSLEKRSCTQKFPVIG